MSRGKQNRNRGIQGEHHALQFLRSQGYRIVQKNYRWRGGEIDLIARDGQTLVFVEVKARKSDSFGVPEESVTLAKQRKIIQTAERYLNEHPTDLDVRFDVISISNNTPKIIKNAFINEV